MRGICVDLWSDGRPGGYDDGWKGDRTVAVTDTKGAFLLAPNGRRRDEPGDVMVRFRDCREKVHFGFEWFADAADISAARVLRYPRSAPITATLDTPAGSISGQVVDSRGAPIAGACVELMDGTWESEAFDDETWWSSYERVTTRSDGRYTFDGLAPKTYRIVVRCVEHNGHRPVWYGGSDDPYESEPEHPAWPPSTAIELGTGENVTDIDVTIHRDGLITGSLTGEGCELAEVRLHREGSRPFVRSAPDRIRDGDCRYEASAAPGTYVAEFLWYDGGRYVHRWYDDAHLREAATPFTVEEGRSATGIDSRYDRLTDD